MSDPGAVRRVVPFAGGAILAVGIALLSAPPSSLPALTLAAGLMGAIFVTALTVPWGRLPAWCETMPPIGFFLVVVLLRDARGGAATGYPPLVMLPVVWMAMYSNRAQLRLAIGGMAATFVLPLLVVGEPLYPRSSWGVSIVSIAIGALAGPAIQHLVDQGRQSTADIAAIGAITRAVKAGADPRPQLCAAAQLVTGAAFAVLFEATGDEVLLVTASTPGIDLGFDISALRVYPRTETGGTARAWRTGTRTYIGNTQTDPAASARLAGIAGTGAVMFEPVLRDGRRLGVLAVAFAEARPSAPKLAVEMIELVAAEIAAAIDRADLVALLAAQARTDPLTGASNRRSWDEEMDRELARAKRTGDPLTVALIDMDHFKAFNDTFGHTAGDELLRDLVLAFRAELRTGDVIARWGGEEFSLALPACDSDEAQAVATRLLRVVPGGQTASIGLTQAVPDDTPRSLIARADRALYAAKDAGRNQAKSLVAPRRT